MVAACCTMLWTRSKKDTDNQADLSSALGVLSRRLTGPLG